MMKGFKSDDNIAPGYPNNYIYRVSGSFALSDTIAILNP